MTESIKLKVSDICDRVDVSALIARPLSEWRPILSEECHVYVFGENYIAKRFDQINYKFCEKNEAKEILIDNLYALLRFKYFPKTSEEIDDRINKIVVSFTANLKTTLHKISFDNASDSKVVKMLPDYCIAFRNGVYNFKDDKWLFKYDVVSLKNLSNKMYIYSNEYVIMWYLDYDFESLGFKIEDVTIEDFITMMKNLTAQPETKNYCFELLYNMSHDSGNNFSISRFKHLCEILGYTALQSFSQFFVLLIGSGQNGKNSLFDGCFSNRLVPRPAANSLDAIEKDRFITGSLENRCHNIFLETAPKVYTESQMIKALTGSMYQTIESKGVNKYSSVINCKYVFAGNNQDEIKFSDNTTGFRRRINMFEITYQWDSGKRFLKRGDYFDTTFSDNLSELKDNVLNTTAYIYFAMYGIMFGTNNFTKNFQFDKNDWSYKYSDINLDTKDKLENIKRTDIYNYIKQCDPEEQKVIIYDFKKTRLSNSTTLSSIGLHGINGIINLFADEEIFSNYFSEYDVYLSVRTLQKIIKDLSSPTVFTQTLKKTYMLRSLEMLNSNKPYVKITFINDKLKILK